GLFRPGPAPRLRGASRALPAWSPFLGATPAFAGTICCPSVLYSRGLTPRLRGDGTFTGPFPGWRCLQYQGPGGASTRPSCGWAPPGVHGTPPPPLPWTEDGHAHGRACGVTAAR